MGRTFRASASTGNNHEHVGKGPESAGLQPFEPRRIPMSIEPDTCTGSYRRGYHLRADGRHVGRLTLQTTTPATTPVHALVTAVRQRLNDCLVIVGGDPQAAILLFAAAGVDGHEFVVSTPEFMHTPDCRPGTAAEVRNRNRLPQLDHRYPRELQRHRNPSDGC